VVSYLIDVLQPNAAELLADVVNNYSQERTGLRLGYIRFRSRSQREGLIGQVWHPCAWRGAFTLFRRLIRLLAWQSSGKTPVLAALPLAVVFHR
jgi:hypothetical protein